MEAENQYCVVSVEDLFRKSARSPGLLGLGQESIQTVSPEG